MWELGTRVHNCQSRRTIGNDLILRFLYKFEQCMKIDITLSPAEPFFGRWITRSITGKGSPGLQAAEMFWKWFFSVVSVCSVYLRLGECVCSAWFHLTMTRSSTRPNLTIWFHLFVTADTTNLSSLAQVYLSSEDELTPSSLGKVHLGFKEASRGVL